MRAGKVLPHVRRKVAKGNVYFYFDTGQRVNGRPVLQRLPHITDRTFGTFYAAKLAARNRVQPVNTSMTVAKMIDLYQRSPAFAKLSESTQRVYNMYLVVLDRDFGPSPAGALERADVMAMLDEYGDRTGAANMLLSVTTAVFAWGRMREHVANKPTEGIGAHDTTDYEPWPEHLLFEALDSDDMRVSLPVALMYYTSQRIGDVCKMRWSDVRDGIVYVTQQKTGKQMEIRLHSALAAMLEKTPRLGLTVFSQPNGRPYTRETTRRYIQAFAVTRGHKIVAHGLRKNAVNALLEAGCTVAETAAVSGQSLALIEHYSKLRSGKTLSTSAILKWQEKRR